jgi:ArsR family transcriptional regulator, arsenate/arsenite/antimonite-responsive transcriptional repressor
MELQFAAVALGALGQETRLSIYRMLVRQGPAGLAAGQIGDALSLAPATLSFHLRELTRAGLIRARQQSRFIYYSADEPAMNKLLGYLAQNCCPASTASQDASSEPPRRIAPPPAKPVVRPKTRAA